MIHFAVLFIALSTSQAADDACRLTGHFMRIRAIVERLDQEVGDTDDIVHRLRHTTRWRPYKRIENQWTDIRKQGSIGLDLLSNIPPTLDFTPQSNKKDAVLELTEAYENDIEHLIDYAHTVAYYERTQTSLSTYMWRRQYLSFGVESDPNRARTDDIARYQLDETANEATSAFMEARPLKRTSASPWSSPTGGLLDAVLGLKIAEHHYANICRTPRFTPILTAIRSLQ
jgi:hypothetical protein